MRSSKWLVFIRSLLAGFDRSLTLAGLEDVRAYGYKAERAAALIYAHFKKEFGETVISGVRII
jgi:hypothetical protein